MFKIVKFEVLDHFRLSLVFNDGLKGVVDLSYLAGKGVFARWNDPDFFRSVRIGQSGELAWGDEIDLCPDSLYLKVTGKQPEDLFPILKHQSIHA